MMDCVWRESSGCAILKCQRNHNPQEDSDERSITQQETDSAGMVEQRRRSCSFCWVVNFDGRLCSVSYSGRYRTVGHRACRLCQKCPAETSSYGPSPEAYPAGSLDSRPLELERPQIYLDFRILAQEAARNRLGAGTLEEKTSRLGLGAGALALRNSGARTPFPL